MPRGATNYDLLASIRLTKRTHLPGALRILLPPLLAPPFQQETAQTRLATCEDAAEMHPLEDRHQPRMHKQAHVVLKTVEWVCIESRPTVVTHILARLALHDAGLRDGCIGVWRHPTGDAILGVVVGGVVADADVRRAVVVRGVDDCTWRAILAPRACCDQLLLRGQLGRHEDARLDLTEALQHAVEVRGAGLVRSRCLVDGGFVRDLAQGLGAQSVLRLRPNRLSGRRPLRAHRGRRAPRLQQSHGVLRLARGTAARGAAGRGHLDVRLGATYEGAEQPDCDPSRARSRHHGKVQRHCAEDPNVCSAGGG
mmetsp:Transcript_38506/g.123755  ORF Transcript_38506/g.123755 Transcript_38506/m.123755 type:complete len:311 (+) Transcript_38506:67-999(+)